VTPTSLVRSLLAIAGFGLFGGSTSVPSVREIHELRVEVGTTTVHALCTAGPRQVILLHDEGGSAESWRPVLERLDGRVGACAYDRAGSGLSQPRPGPRGWYELIDELRRIHRALGFDRSYVVVGHGLGGLYARVYAADRTRDVAGLVLVDPSHESMPERARTGMPADAWDEWMAQRRRPNADGVTEVEVAERARQSRLPLIPVTVITASIRRDGDGWSQRFLNEAARYVHGTILDGVATPRHIPASYSGHDVPSDEPQLVTDEILRMTRIAAGG
jgi:pimeloyl-ACP methyl ester carboxylesterase